MVTIARPRFRSVLLLLTAIMLVHPLSALADRIDIDDPSVLGPVLSARAFTIRARSNAELPRFGTKAGSTRMSTLCRVVPTFRARGAVKPAW